MVVDHTPWRKQEPFSKAKRGAFGDVRVAILVGTTTIRALWDRAGVTLRASRCAKPTDLALLTNQWADGHIIGAWLIGDTAVGASFVGADVIERAILVLVAARRGVALAGLAAVRVDHVAIRAVDVTDRTITGGWLSALADLAPILASLEPILASERADDRVAGGGIVTFARLAAILAGLETALALDGRASDVRA